MDVKDITARALQIRKLYSQYELEKYGREWTTQEIAQGLVGDVGDLMKLVMAKCGIREIADVETKLGHELVDCLWSLLVLAEAYSIDLESEFVRSMDLLEKRIGMEMLNRILQKSSI
jgi:NTP pyrophosphatase (non-canonical NTP hydrolase)